MGLDDPLVQTLVATVDMGHGARDENRATDINEGKAVETGC